MACEYSTAGWGFGLLCLSIAAYNIASLYIEYLKEKDKT